MNTQDQLLLERHGRVAVLTINRPAVHNALNAHLLARIGKAVGELSAEAGIRAIVVTGTGERAFSAGADIDEFVGIDGTRATDILGSGQRVMSGIARSSVPVIAAVNGVALGGGFELVLSCSFALVSTAASFGLPESALGLIPGYGGTQRLAAVIGRPAAAHAMLTGTRLSAERAYQLGLAALPPVAPDELMATAVRVAEETAARGPSAQAAILQALATSSPDQGPLALETALAAVRTSSDEAAIGIAAFKDRRTPDFPARPEGIR